MWDEMHCVCACGHVGQIALGESAKFVGTTGFPLGALGAGAERLVFGGEACVWVDGFVGRVDGRAGGIKPIQVVECEVQVGVFQGGAGGGVQVAVASPESVSRERRSWWLVLQQIGDVVGCMLGGGQDAFAASATTWGVEITGDGELGCGWLSG